MNELLTDRLASLYDQLMKAQTLHSQYTIDLEDSRLLIDEIGDRIKDVWKEIKTVKNVLSQETNTEIKID